jgi:hypothetical protein
MGVLSNACQPLVDGQKPSFSTTLVIHLPVRLCLQFAVPLVVIWRNPRNAVSRSLLVAVDAEALISGQGYGFACPCCSLDAGGGHFDVQ